MNDFTSSYIFLTYKDKIDYSNQNFEIKNWEDVWRFGLFVDIFVSKKKKHVHFAFKKTLSLYSCLNEFVSFVRKEWEKRYMFFRHYEMCYPKLIPSVKWGFGYVFL